LLTPLEQNKSAKKNLHKYSTSGTEQIGAEHKKWMKKYMARQSERKRHLNI
jgi:hypothetical protein